MVGSSSCQHVLEIFGADTRALLGGLGQQKRRSRVRRLVADAAVAERQLGVLEGVEVAVCLRRLDHDRFLD